MKTTIRVPTDPIDFRIGFNPIKNKYYVQNTVTLQYILRNGKIGEYRDIGEGINGWYETKEEANEVLNTYRLRT